MRNPAPEYALLLQDIAAFRREVFDFAADMQSAQHVLTQRVMVPVGEAMAQEADYVPDQVLSPLLAACSSLAGARGTQCSVLVWSLCFVVTERRIFVSPCPCYAMFGADPAGGAARFSATAKRRKRRRRKRKRKKKRSQGRRGRIRYQPISDALY